MYKFLHIWYVVCYTLSEKIAIKLSPIFCRSSHPKFKFGNRSDKIAPSWLRTSDYPLTRKSTHSQRGYCEKLNQRFASIRRIMQNYTRWSQRTGIIPENLLYRMPATLLYRPPIIARQDKSGRDYAYARVCWEFIYDAEKCRLHQYT